MASRRPPGRNGALIGHCSHSATGEHADGFGLAFHEGAACRHFVDDGRASDEPWEPFAAGELRVFADGEQVWQAAP